MRFSRDGIQLRSGEELKADLVVTATGLELQMVGGVEVEVDGQRVDISRGLTYKGCMLTDVPNLATFFGYTNASWTLKADLTARWLCRLLKHMDDHGIQRCVARRPDRPMTEKPMLELASGYVQRALSRLPKQGSKWPFRTYQNHVYESLAMRLAKIDDGSLELTRATGVASRKRAPDNTTRPEI